MNPGNKDKDGKSVEENGVQGAYVATHERHTTDRDLTRPQRDGEPALPHERDESPSGDEPEQRGSRSEIKQAKEDVDQGQRDTDLRGTPSNVPPSQ